ISGTVAIRGTVQDAHLAGWQLSYTGGPAQTWVVLASGSGPVNNGVLANWNTTGLPACGYTLRLIASDSAIVNCNGAINNRSESLVSVQIGGANPCPTDIDGDGDIDLQDLAYLLSDFGTHCP
ncbi:MAG: hypothetical protein HZB38_16710, partial [Planctomycetes bacterium]|nr:hypothetical protein [Planctomycetota bacterium]